MRPAMTSDELMHFGIKGMKWGVRRYQNPDGTRTDAGRKRYGSPKFLTKFRNKRTTKRIATQQKSDRARIGEMSDEELDQKINRLRKEKELINLMNDTQVQESGKKKVKLGLAEAGAKLLKDASYKIGMDYVNDFMSTKTRAGRLKNAADKLKYQKDVYDYTKSMHDFERAKARESFNDRKEDLKYQQDSLKYKQDKLKYFKDVEAFKSGNYDTGKKKKKKK